MAMDATAERQSEAPSPPAAKEAGGSGVRSSKDSGKPKDGANDDETRGCLMCGACGPAGRCVLD